MFISNCFASFSIYFSSNATVVLECTLGGSGLGHFSFTHKGEINTVTFIHVADTIIY